MTYQAPTTADKRAARLQRGTLLALRNLLTPDTGREKLSLNAVQRQLRNDLERGYRIRSHTDHSGKRLILGQVEKQRVGKLRPDECRAVQPAAVEPEYGLLFADLTPTQRRQLRKYRAGKRRERDLAVAHKQLKREGEIAEAQRHLRSALKAADATSIQYWQRRLDVLTK